VPFEEDDKDPSIWFLDHSYLENMFRMFKKVNGACSNAPGPLLGSCSSSNSHSKGCRSFFACQ
jgi:hypothetical protein